MKTLRLLLLLCLLIPISRIRAQNIPNSSSLGSAASFINALKGSAPASNARAATSEGIEITLPDGSSLTATIDVVKTYGTKECFHGKINNSNSFFNVFSSNGTVEGSIVLKDTKRAYILYSDKTNTVFIKEENIQKVLCTEYATKSAAASSSSNALPPGQSVSNLQSYPSASAVIYLDFNGQYVPAGSWGAAIDAQPSGMSDDEIYIAWQISSEDFRPFNVNVTTDEAVYLNAPANSRMRAIITTTTTAAPGWGGVAFIGSFTWGNDTPCWVFNLGGKYAGETVSHEVGHTLGLGHDGTTLGDEYYYGANNWAPIMGAGYYVDISQWSKGEYQNANNQQDDLAIISTQNGFGYRTDAPGNTPASAIKIITDNSGIIVPYFNTGVIETRSDVDVFYFSKKVSGSITLNVNATTQYSDVDILLTLKDANQNVLATSNPATLLSASVTASLPAGTYYLYIEGVGKGSPLTDYSDYASIGQYEISGTLPPPVLTNIALNKPTTSSTAENVGTGSVKATDGNYSTRWSSAFYDPQWITVDLLQPYNISRIKITWEAAYGKNYKIQTSNTNNGTDWVDLKTVTGNTTLVNDWTGLATTARYVRIYGTVRGTGYGYSIYELEVYEGLPNIPPTVSFTAPANNALFPPNSTINLAANATDSDGTITKVEFFNGAVKLGEDLTAPYTYSWKNVPVGSYTLNVKSTDNRGGTALASIAVKVATLNPPTVVITSPINGSVFPMDQYITLSADVNDVDGTISKVEFYLNGTLFTTDYEAPYVSLVSVSAALTETLTVIAYDNIGLSTTSAPVSFTIIENVLPKASIRIPANGNNFLAPAVITISVDVYDEDGTVTKVEYYNGAVKIGEVLRNTPISYVDFNWYNVPVGTYTITAVSVDNKGGRGTSLPVTFNVVPGAPNIALRKPATTSSVEGPNADPSLAVDGNGSTRWSSGFSDNQWITVDLGARYDINRVIIVWEAAYGKNFKVQLSNTNNGTDWTDLKNITNNTALINDWEGLSGTGRYIRMLGITRALGYGYSIFEFQVYGTATGSGISPALSSGSITTFPNPAQDQVSIAFASEYEINQPAELVLMDSFSQVIAAYTKAAGDSTVTLNTSALQTGVYLLKVNTGGTYSTQRILISR